jgi:hypothetical protein
VREIHISVEALDMYLSNLNLPTKKRSLGKTNTER